MCFVSPDGWIYGGADFSALEAMGEALLSRDPNKLKVYIDGFDSNCVNAFAYFPEQMPDIHQATPTDKCFKITQDNQVYFMKATDRIKLEDGTILSIGDYYTNVMH